MSNVVVPTAQIQILVKRAVIDLFQEVVADPDRGLEIKDWVEKRLAKINARPVSKGRLTALTDLISRSG